MTSMGEHLLKNVCPDCRKKLEPYKGQNVYIAGKREKQKEDTRIIDWLEEQNKKARYTGKCIFRWSGTGRGWRLHETSGLGAVESVRQAILNAMEEDKK